MSVSESLRHSASTYVFVSEAPGLKHVSVSVSESVVDVDSASSYAFVFGPDFASDTGPDSYSNPVLALTESVSKIESVLNLFINLTSKLHSTGGS